MTQKTKRQVRIEYEARSELLKCGIHILTAPSFTTLFNFLLKTGHRPDAWPSGLISPMIRRQVDPSKLQRYLRHQLTREIILFPME